MLLEEPEILDTGGGLKAAAPHLKADVAFTANPDVFWLGPNPFLELSQLAIADSDATLLLVPEDRAHGRKGGGDFRINADGTLERGGPMVYSGIQIIRLEHVTEVPEQVFSLNVVWDRLIMSRTLRGVVYSGSWCDVGSPEGLAEASQLLAESQNA